MNRCLLALLYFLSLAYVVSAKPPKVDSSATSLAAVSNYLAVVPDVTGKQFVLANINEGSHLYREEAHGWRDEAGYITFLNGKVLMVKKFEDINFLEEVQQSIKRSKLRTARNGGDPFGGSYADVDTQLTKALAAIWLHRSGNEKLAMECWKATNVEITGLRKAEIYKEYSDWELLLDLLGGYSPWGQFEGAINAYWGEDFLVSLEYMERLEKLAPASMSKYGNGGELLLDLKRREKRRAADVNKALVSVAKYRKWDDQRKIQYLIHQLELIKMSGDHYPNWNVFFNFSGDWSVRELVNLGDTAVPALIDCLEKDQRLTRTIYRRDFGREVTVISVREVALYCLHSILQESFYEPKEWYQCYTAVSKERHLSIVKKIRVYWQNNRETNREQRWMNRLLDDEQSMPRRLKAMKMLAYEDKYFFKNTSLWSMRVAHSKKNDVHPLVNRFNHPTLAEAIWKVTLANKADRREWQNCLKAVAQLRDKRIIPQLKEMLLAEQDLLRKIQLAITIDVCGDASALTEMIIQLQQGTLTYKKRELARLIELLVPVRNRAVEDYLMQFANPKHPNYKDVLLWILEDTYPFARKEKEPFTEHSLDDEEEESGGETVDEDLPLQVINFSWSHPFVIKMLTDQLSNKRHTEMVFVLAGDCFLYGSRNSLRRLPISGDYMELMQEGGDPFSDKPSGALEARIVKLRFCDVAAMRLNKIVPDTTLFLPLLKNRDAVINSIRVQLLKSPPRELSQPFNKFLGYDSGKRFFYLKPPVVRAKSEIVIKRSGISYPVTLPYYTFLRSRYNVYEPLIILGVDEGVRGKKHCVCITGNGVNDYYLLSELLLNAE